MKKFEEHYYNEKEIAANIAAKLDPDKGGILVDDIVDVISPKEINIKYLVRDDGLSKPLSLDNAFLNVEVERPIIQEILKNCFDHRIKTVFDYPHRVVRRLVLIPVSDLWDISDPEDPEILDSIESVIENYLDNL